MVQEEQKYSKFLAAITREANENREAFLAEMKEYKQQKIEEAKITEQQNYEGRLQKLKGVVHEDCGREISHKILDVRKELFSEREKIKNDVFEQVRVKIAEFCKSEQYNEFLKQSVGSLKEYFVDGSYIEVRSQDKNVVDALVGIPVKVNDEILLGGVRVICNDIVYDDTIDTRLANQSSWFEENSALEIN